MAEPRELTEIFPRSLTLTTPEGWAEYGLIAAGYPVGYVEPPAPDPQPPAAPQMTLYSQRDPRWRSVEYAGGVTFGAAGCYVTCVAMVLSLAGYTDTPPEVAEKLRNAGAFAGPYLTGPQRIPAAYPRMRYDGPNDVSRDGELRWHQGGADVARLLAELAKCPVIIEVDFNHKTAEFNQHFVVALRATDDGGDLVIADPWDGVETRLLQRYASADWDLSRAVYGARLLRVK